MKSYDFCNKLTLETFEEKYNAAKEYLKELEEEKNQVEDRIQKQKIRLAKEKKEKLEEAIKELEKFRKEKDKAKKRQRKKAQTKEKVKNLRVSSTDVEARKMKMGDGGFRPAFNMQFATTVKGQAIAGVGITNSGSDSGLMKPMFERVVEKYGITPKAWLADCGFLYQEDIEFLEKANCKVILPPRKSGTSDPYKPKKGDSEEMAQWRERMGTEEAKKKYQMRPQTAEFPNAEARNRGLTQLLVRGLEKALNVGLLFAITHNFLRLNNLTSGSI